MIHSEIAVITASGKAYYKLVKELKGRSISFLSLIPGDTIPFYVRMCITTDSEKKWCNVQTFLYIKKKIQKLL